MTLPHVRYWYKYFASASIKNLELNVDDSRSKIEKSNSDVGHFVKPREVN